MMLVVVCPHFEKLGITSKLIGRDRTDEWGLRAPGLCNDSARNEEANIARCVRSVTSQRGVREIIVSDDNSQDRTNDILEDLRHEIPQLQTIHLESLPAGWMGKTYALAAAAKSAEGQWLLFTDADTEHLPGSLATLVERGKSEQADLLSVSPGQQTPTWWEKAVIPQVYVRLARLYRFEEVSDPRSPPLRLTGSTS